MDLWQSVGLLLGPFVMAGLGAHLGAYLKRKGENLATKEDLQIVAEQVRATTTITENIKAEMTGKLWISQEQWKLKIDLYTSLMSILEAMGTRQRYLADYLARKYEGQPVRDFPDLEITDKLNRIMVLTQIVAPDLMTVLQPLKVVEKRPAGDLKQHDFEDKAKMYQQVYFAVAAAARKDLRLESV